MSTSVYSHWLFDDAVTNADYTQSKVWLMNEQGIAKDLEMSGYLLSGECSRNVGRGTKNIRELP
jgi:hypothetical protein